MNRIRSLLPILVLSVVAVTAQAAMQFDVTLSGASEVGIVGTHDELCAAVSFGGFEVEMSRRLIV